MKLIRDLEEYIDDEIHDIKKYAKMAAQVKAEYPTLAQVLYNISVQEDAHQAAIHNEVVKIIEEHRRQHGEPPAAMMAVYDYLHQKSIDKLAEARVYQDLYKNS
jgi:rubrerythrin